MDKAEELAAIERELALYRDQPVPEFMIDAVEHRKVKLRERLAELGEADAND
ncbi:MAG TPA: hypothetical protein VLL82_07300 [Mycobacterium sp.]|nr:hypothetical protein [Mycobacterium sp.]